MARVERDWTRRIPGWVWVEKPGKRRRARPDELGDEGAAPPKGQEDGDEAEALADADEDRESPERDEAQAQSDGPPDGVDEPQADADSADSDASDGGNGDADGDADGEQTPDDLRLNIPEEVEERRRDEEERQRRSARNLGYAPKAFGLEGHYLRNLATRFARMVSKVAEDSADLPSEGDEEWDLDELIKRRFTGRLISQCRMTREKRKVAVVLDTSPSCEHQARLFASIARVAEELGDCELFDAPNFVITARKLDDEWESLPAAERDWHFKGRVVLAFGDFDGIDRINAASRVRGNRIYWFCCEERPSVLEHARETFVKGYKGHYFATSNLNDLMQAMKRVR